MAIGRISGPLLKANLIRNGIDLAFETDLLYLDVNNQRIGIKTITPQHELDINGTTRTTNLIVTNRADIGSVNIQGNTISSDQQYLNLGTLDNVVYQNKLTIDSIDINDNVISTNDSNANLELRPNGTGTVEVFSDVNVTGDIYASGNITADGNITIGDADTDNVVFNAEVASDIIPDQTDTYSLGSNPATGGKEWNDLWVNNIIASSVSSGDLEVDGIDLTLRQGNIYYVAENGDDTKTGTHPQDPYASLSQALSVAAAGDTVYLYPGVYQETFPLTVPVGVTVKGHSIRGVKIVPTSATDTNSAFLLNGETTVADLTIADFFQPGHAFEYASGFTVTTRSPYIKNISVITKGSVTTAEDPRGFNQGDAGGGVYFDGAVATTSSNEASGLFHSVTFITPGVDAVQLTNGVRVEWLNSFTYFANRSIYAFDGASGLYGAGKTRIRLGGISGSFNAGDTVTFTSTDSSTVVVVTVDAVQGNVLEVDEKTTDLIGFDTTPQSISNGTGATATTILSLDFKDFGAEIRMIGSASVYGNFGLVGDGPGVLMYAIGHNLAYIGVGKEVTNDPQEVIQINEVVETNDAQIRYNSVDHKGDFRVGDLFYVNQEDGTVNFSVSDFTINTTGGVTFTNNGDTTFIDGDRIETGDWRISGNTIETLTQDANFDSAGGDINLNANVNVTGNLDVTGNVTIGGNITIGDEATDTIQFVAGIDSDIVPKVDSAYSLGTATKTWSNLWVNQINVDDIEIRDNYIQTTASNADLELRANGTGIVYLPNNDVQIDNNLTVDGTATLAGTNITGTVTLVGDFAQTGNQTVTGDVTVGENLTVGASAQFEEILIDDNFITTTSSNADLELRASGTGDILIPNNDLTVNNDVSVTGNVDANNVTVAANVTSDSANIGDVQITSSLIESTASNADLELRANGTGNIIVPTNDVVLGQDLTVNGSTDLQDVDITGTLTHVGNTTQTGNYTITGQFSNGDVTINGNTITTTVSDSDLELRASGTGEVVVPTNDVTLGQNLTVNGSTDLQDVAITGTITHIGDISQTGTLTVNGDFDNGNISINDNIITTTDSNSDLELRASGTGEVVVPTNDVTLGQDLTVNGSTDLQGTEVTGTITHVGDVTQIGNYTVTGSWTNGDLQFDSNTITTTQSNSDLELRANGTGEIVFPNNDVEIVNNLTVSGDTDLQDTEVTGTITHTGNTVQVGNTTITGNVSISGTVDIASTAQFEDIKIEGNVVTTTDSNSDLELRASGTGDVIVPSNDVQITNDLFVDGTITVGDVTSAGTITANRFSTGDILIDDNFITTTLSNSDLELRANGTGDVIVPENNVVFDQNLTVSGTTDLQDTTVTGNITQTGDVAQTGNINLTGNLNIDGTVTISSATQFENVRVEGNTVSTTDSNSDLELSASGSGTVSIPNNDAVITGNLTVDGTFTVGEIVSSGTIQANNFTTGDILIDDNFITTTTSNSNLELRTSGTGSIVIDDFSIVDSTISSSSDITLSLGSENIVIDSTGSLQIPVGTTAERPTAQTGQIRFNETLNRYEGYNGTNWIQLNGVIDLDGDTKVTAELTEGANDDIIRFDIAGSTLVTVNSNELSAHKITVDEISIDGNTIATNTSGVDLVLEAQGTGSIVFDNFAFKDNTITNTISDSVTEFSNTDNGYVKFDGTYGLVLPSGTTSERPQEAFSETGMTRFNTTDGRVEVYDGANWISVAGAESGISRSDAENIAFEIVLSLG